MSECDIMFSQYAQDPFRTASAFEQACPELCRPARKERQPKPVPKRKNSKCKKSRLRGASYVINNEIQKGIRLIKIKVIDICDKSPVKSNTESEEENIVLSAQYVVKDVLDDIMDDTETVIRKICKKISDNNF